MFLTQRSLGTSQRGWALSPAMHPAGFQLGPFLLGGQPLIALNQSHLQHLGKSKASLSK